MDERALRIVWTIFLFGLLLTIVYFIRGTILLFAVSIFFAYMLWPFVSALERLMPKRRIWALGIVYVVFIGLLVLLGFEFLPAVATEATTFATRLPALLQEGRVATIHLPHWLEPIQAQIVSTLHQVAVHLEASLVPFIQHASTRVLSGLKFIVPVVLIPILAFFFLKEGTAIQVSLLGAVEEGRDRTVLKQIIEDVHTVLQSYIRALVLLALASFVAWIAFLSLMGYPYKLLLAGLAGILEFIPVFGPAAALVIMLIVIGITGSGGLIWIAVFWACYRVFQDYMLNPYLMSAGVELHPLLVLFGVLAGENLAGIPGMFFSVPVIAILKVVYVQLRRRYARPQLTPETAAPHHS